MDNSQTISTNSSSNQAQNVSDDTKNNLTQSSNEVSKEDQTPQPKTVTEIQDQVQQDNQSLATEKIISKEMQEREEKIDQDIEDAKKEAALENETPEKEFDEEEKSNQIAQAIQKTMKASGDNSSVQELEEKI